MTEEEAASEAQRWYIDNILTPYTPFAPVQCSEAEPVIGDGFAGWLLDVWCNEPPGPRIKVLVDDLRGVQELDEDEATE